MNCVFGDVGCYVSFADLGLCDAFLVATHRGDDADVFGVDFCYDADYQFLPFFTACLAPVAFTQVSDIFDGAAHG